MDFLRSYFFMNDSPVMKTLERRSLNVKKCLFNVLITGESNFDERNGQRIRGSFLKKWLLKKIHTLNDWMKKRQQILLNLCIIPILLYNYVVLVKKSQKNRHYYLNKQFVLR